MREQLIQLALDAITQIEKQTLALVMVIAGALLNFHPDPTIKQTGNLILGAGLHRLTQ
jgi:hypothetical protein